MKRAPVDTANESALCKRKSNSRSADRIAQIKRLLHALRLRPHHTYELRKLGISHPAGRIQDLEADGHVISSHRINTVDPDGYLHTGVALYSLIAETDHSSGVDHS